MIRRRHRCTHANTQAKTHTWPPNNSCQCSILYAAFGNLYFSPFFSNCDQTATTTPTNHDGRYNNHFKPQREIEKPRAVGGRGIEISAQFQSAKKSVEGPPIKHKTTATIRKKKKKKEPDGK